MAPEKEQDSDTGRVLPVNGEHSGHGSAGPSGDLGRAQRMEVQGGKLETFRGRFMAPWGAVCFLSRGWGLMQVSMRESHGQGCPGSALRGGEMEGGENAGGATADGHALSSGRAGLERCVGLMRPLPLVTSGRGKGDEWARWLEA